jgi:hypothetical protein
LSVAAAELMTFEPVAVEPVKPIFATPGWDVSAPPRSLSSQMTLNTPGRRMSLQISPMRHVVKGVVGAGLATTVLPAKSAGATLRSRRPTGTFQGVMAATTPSGPRRSTLIPGYRSNTPLVISRRAWVAVSTP